MPALAEQIVNLDGRGNTLQGIGTACDCAGLTIAIANAHTATQAMVTLETTVVVDADSVLRSKKFKRQTASCAWTAMPPKRLIANSSFISFFVMFIKYLVSVIILRQNQPLGHKRCFHLSNCRDHQDH